MNIYDKMSPLFQEVIVASSVAQLKLPDGDSRWSDFTPPPR